MIRMMAYKGIPTLCIPHNSAGVIEAPDRDVQVGASANFVALNGDPCPCAVGGPDLIMAGMTDVVVNDIPVAGWMHHTSHNAAPPLAPNAMVEWGDTWILMGGGTTVGNVQASLAACKCLQASRASKGPDQSGQNCGVESMRQLINAKRKREGKDPLSEDFLLNDALSHGDSYVTPKGTDAGWDATLIEKDDAIKREQAKLDAAKKDYDDSVSVWNANKGDPEKLKALQKAQARYKSDSQEILVDRASGVLVGTESELKEKAAAARERQKERADRAVKAPDFNDPDRAWAGGTLPGQQRRMLDRYGIPTTEISQDPSTGQNMTDLEDAVARGRGVIVGVQAGALWGNGAEGGHAVLVTGVAYDENGQVVGYVTNDTAKGCGRRVPRDQFRGALRPELKATVTRDPIW